jgi:hypothetical protein
MAGKAQPSGWGGKPLTPPAAVAPPTIEDRLSTLEANASGLTETELKGLRALLERAGFDPEQGSF